jgi:prevent-host-death family protein
MQRVGSREFKNRLGRYLRAVRNGQTLLVTDRGQPVAKVSPPEQDIDSQMTFTDVLKKLEAEGKIRLPKRPLGKFRAVKIKGKPASQTILEDRR